jgi:hypothetical protein
MGVEVDYARDDSCRGSFAAWFYLAAKSSHVGVDMDGLACRLHHPTVHSCQSMGQGLPPGVILSYCCSRQWRLSGDVKPPEL